jgi:hypothetical protein
MNTTPDRLTEILHKRADTKLRAKIEEALPPSADLRETVGLTLAHYNLKHCVETGKYWLPYLLDAAREGLLAAQVETARAAEVADFLAKVENTAAELDAIREEINQ